MAETPEEDRLLYFLSDRPKFKLYSAAQHLTNLKSIEATYGGLAATKARIPGEMEIDDFLGQILGAVHSLFVEINEKLDLGIPMEDLDFSRVQSGLSARTKKIDLLSDLDKARQYGGWYWHLVEMKNSSMRSSISTNVVEGRDHATVFFRRDPRDPTSTLMDVEVIPYLGQCLSSMEKLIDTIRSDPTLV